MGPKHRLAERTAIYEPTTQTHLTDETEILKATLFLFFLFLILVSSFEHFATVVDPMLLS